MTKIGVFAPNWIGDHVTRSLLSDWARIAEDAGFSMLATIDRPNSDTWDPLVTLAGLATITNRIRLAPMVLQLPNRDEVLVAKHSATIDRLSDGRFELGVGAAARRDDFAALGAKFSDRWQRFPAQIARIRQVWADATAAEPEDAFSGPAPVQVPGPPVWVAATLPETMKRAVRIGDGIILSQGNDLLPGTAKLVSSLRQEASEAGKDNFLVGRVLFVAVGKRRAPLTDEALASLRRFYGAYAWTGIENMVAIGSSSDVKEIVEELSPARLDLLLLIPTIADLAQLEALAELIVH
jgi:alkanesulfonate monooxygenase SsuD/methylene tetrahydromethanopterin reductase-like flavin-dependent oxidoreductase (luciferase family)